MTTYTHQTLYNPTVLICSPTRHEI